MPVRRTAASRSSTRSAAKVPRDARVTEVLAWLERRGTARNRDGMARYGIVAPKVFGVSMATMQSLAKRLGRDHALAQALWETGWYEARMLCAFVGEPERLTAAEMDRWARDFDNWGICDTICMHLFDRTPHAWRKVAKWSGQRDEFVKRAGFALIASLALHDKEGADAPFLEALRLVEREAADSRNFVKKAVNWALRSVGSRNSVLHGAALAVAERLSALEDATARWVGKDAVRALRSAPTLKRVARGDQRPRAPRKAPRR
jgi:3-methyladenine DNA glycosylase AlkD